MADTTNADGSLRTKMFDGGRTRVLLRNLPGQRGLYLQDKLTDYDGALIATTSAGLAALIEGLNEALVEMRRLEGK